MDPITEGELEGRPRSAKGHMIDCFEAVVGAGKSAGSRTLDAVLVTGVQAAGTNPKKYDELLRTPRLGAARRSLHDRWADVPGIPHRVGLIENLRRPSFQPAPAQDGNSGDGGGPPAPAYHDACNDPTAHGLRDNPGVCCVKIPMCSSLETVEAGVCAQSAGTLQPGATKKRRAGADQSRRLSNTRRTGRSGNNRLQPPDPPTTWAAQPARSSAPSRELPEPQRRGGTS